MLRPTDPAGVAQATLALQRLRSLLVRREPDDRDYSPRVATRATRWATVQVGCGGRAVIDVARDLGCDWHAVIDAVVAVGGPLIDHPDRIGRVTALGLDETLFARVAGSAPS